MIRSAKTRDELGQFKINIESQPKGSIIGGETYRAHSGQELDPMFVMVFLRLPNYVNLFTRSGSRDVHIGNLGGHLVLESINCSAEGGDVGAAARVSSVSGSVELGRVGSMERSRA